MKINLVKKGLVIGIICLLMLVTIPMTVSIKTIILNNDNLVVTAITDKSNYLVGEPVVVTVWIKNIGDEDITIVFPSAQLADFNVYNEGEIIYKWSSGKVFASVLTPVTIPCGVTVKLLEDEWEQIDSEGNQVPVGNYDIRGWMVWANNHPEIHAEPVYIRISDNHPPNAPKIKGPVIIVTPEIHYWSFNATDPDGDSILFYEIDWGDGFVSEKCVGPFESGEEIIRGKIYSKKCIPKIRARATDMNGETGDWGYLRLGPKDKQMTNLLNRAIQRMSNFFYMLKFQ